MATFDNGYSEMSVSPVGKEAYRYKEGTQDPRNELEKEIKGID